ncbi:hypothetical protein Tco_1116346 [Tanacetum coccineum]
MGGEHLSTILETESDELIKSSVENLVLIPSESEDECECDVPDCDDSQTTNFSTFSNPLFDDSTSSDDESSHEEVIHEMSFKTYSNPLFDLDEEIISSQGGAGSSFGSSNKKKSKGKAASGSGRDSGGASGKGKVVTEPTRKTKKVKEYSSRSGGVSVGASVVSQNGASSPIVQTSPSSCHGTAGQNVQGDQSGGADYSGNGGGFKTWVSYSGSATVATPASSAGQTIQGVESGGPSKSHIGTTNSGNGKSPDVPRNEDHIAKPEISRRINGHDGRDPRDVEIERLRQRVCELEIQHEIRQIRKRIRELELQREMRKETQIEIPSVWDEGELRKRSILQIVSQNGASSPIVQTSPSSCHGTAGQSVQGDQSGGADYSGNGGGFKTWVSYSGSATVATPASSAGQTIQGVESGGPSKSHIGTTNSGNGDGFQPWGSYV